jgi:hypothetical protein
MDKLKEVSIVIIWLIRVGIIFRVSFSFFKMIYEEDEGLYRKRIKNSLIFYLLAESVFQLKDIATYYFGNRGGG